MKIWSGLAEDLQWIFRAAHIIVLVERPYVTG